MHNAQAEQDFALSHQTSNTPLTGEHPEEARIPEAIARISAVDRDRYLIRHDAGECPAELTGRFLYHKAAISGLPCVGDWVRVQHHDDGSPSRILEILPRKTVLRRRTPGESTEFQMIAANIDTAFLVQSCHYDFNIPRLERYLVMVNEGQIEPVIVLTKTDLISEQELAERLDQIRACGIAAQILTLSNLTGEGVEIIRERLRPGETCCLLGSSGVGKTTLINRLLGERTLSTGEVSHSGEGRHTTTRRQLIALPNGALLIDMPGMRELGIMDAKEGIEESFADIVLLSQQCRFSNCTHGNEPGCAIRQAIKQGELDERHFRNYLKLKKESDFHEMSQYDKRQKDREFGKLVHAVLKDKDRRHRY